MNRHLARVWHGLTREADAQRYLKHIQAKGIPAYRAVEGNKGALALRRVSNGVAEFQVISFWDSRDAIRRFTNSEDIDAAVYYPEDYKCLLYPEPAVAHYELAIWVVVTDSLP